MMKRALAISLTTLATLVIGLLTLTGTTSAAGGKKDRLTEAYCYIGLQKMVEHDPGAEADLRWVIEHGNKNFVEYEIAVER